MKVIVIIIIILDENVGKKRFVYFFCFLEKKFFLLYIRSMCEYGWFFGKIYFYYIENYNLMSIYRGKKKKICLYSVVSC